MVCVFICHYFTSESFASSLGLVFLEWIKNHIQRRSGYDVANEE